MKTKLTCLLTALSPLLAAQSSYAATAEVTKSGSNFIVRVDGAQTLSTTSYSAALQNAAGVGDRIMNVRVEGNNWTGQVQMRSNSTFNYLTTAISDSNTATRSIYGYKSGGLRVDGLRLRARTSYGIQFSSCATPRFNNVGLDHQNSGTVVSVRVDSSGSTRTTGCYARNVRVSNMASGDRQGFETYSIDGYDLSDMRGTSIGGCGVLINDGRSGNIGTTNTNTCGKGTTYAGLRWANNCDTATASSATDVSSSRGIFILNATRVTVNNCNLQSNPTDSIWIQNGSNNRVLAGTVRGPKRPVITNSAGSSINVSYSP
jgi:parallel beta-helix repeat protein